MKIYTKIIYEWLDDHLVEKSSESFEYEGDLTLCTGGGGGGGGTIGQVTKNVSTATTDVLTDPVGTITEAPKAAVEMIEQTPEAIKGEVENVVEKTTDFVKNPLGIFDQPQQPVEEPVAAPDKEPEIWTASGYKGKKKRNNPFLAIDKGKKFARSTSQFRRPTSSIKKIPT